MKVQYQPNYPFSRRGQLGAKFATFRLSCKLSAAEWLVRRVFVGNWQFRRLLLVRAIIRLEEELSARER